MDTGSRAKKLFLSAGVLAIAAGGFAGGLYYPQYAQNAQAQSKGVSAQPALWTDGSLVKTWAMRGTLHLLPRAELPLFFGALSTYTHFLKQGWVKYFGLTREVLEKVIAALAQTLPGRALTRDYILERVWGNDESYSNTVSFHVASLRKKIDAEHAVKLIQTVHGIGYALRGPESEGKP